MRSFVYALKIRVLLAALAVMPTVCAALTPPPLAATALYPSSDAVANKATPTLSARYDNPAGSAGTVRFEVYDVGGITLVATGIGPAVLPGARSSWTVPTGLLVSGRAYHWRAQAQGARAGPSGGQTTMFGHAQLEGVRPDSRDDRRRRIGPPYSEATNSVWVACGASAVMR
jgi:hypothetical protein